MGLAAGDGAQIVPVPRARRRVFPDKHEQLAWQRVKEQRHKVFPCWPRAEVVRHLLLREKYTHGSAEQRPEARGHALFGVRGRVVKHVVRRFGQRVSAVKYSVW